MDRAKLLADKLSKQLVFTSLFIILSGLLVFFIGLNSVNFVGINKASNNSDVRGIQTSPKQVVFAENRPQPFSSDWINVEGYKTITINLAITKWITQYSVEYSNDKISITEQFMVSCGNNSQCPETTLPLLGKYYRVTTGTALGEVTAAGILN